MGFEHPMEMLQRALGLMQAGNLDGAAELCRAVLMDAPNHSNALDMLGLIKLRLGLLDEAETLLCRAAALDPDQSDILIHYGIVLLRQRKLAEALDQLNSALSLSPQNSTARAMKAVALLQAGRGEEALHAVDYAIALKPDCADFYMHRGNILMQLERRDAAREAYAKANALNPLLIEPIFLCANSLMEEYRMEEALSWASKAIAAPSSRMSALLLRANILFQLGRRDECLAGYAAAIDAGHTDARWHRGTALLLFGDLKAGFRDYEHRYREANSFQAMDWQGESLSGRRILIHADQGRGDTIQFVRFLPALVRMGAAVTFLCYPNLVRLFAPFAQQMEIVSSCAEGRRFDFKCPMASLPFRLDTDLETIPGESPYLYAEPALVEKWRARLGKHGFRIGIGWQGNPWGQIDRGRSIPLEKFRPLSAIPGVRLISLQKFHGLDQLDNLPQGMKVETLGDFDDGQDGFVDTAAIMRCLDLVVASDTVTPHLAGALGVPTWLALKHVPDWRWMLERDDSPWYPSLRLFRQKRPGEWEPVFATMAERLRQRPLQSSIDTK